MVYPEGDILEVPLGPEPVDNGGHVVSRHGDFHSLGQASQLEDLGGTEIVVPFHGNPAYDILAGIVIVNLHSGLLLGMECTREDQGQSKQDCLYSSHQGSIHKKYLAKIH